MHPTVVLAPLAAAAALRSLAPPMSSARLAAALPALKIRPLRLLLAGQAVSFVGDALFPVALAFAVLDELDGTPGQLGLVLAAQALPLAVLVLAAGVWADRLPRQRLMLVSDFGRMVVQAVVAALLLSGSAELWMLVALVALYGTSRRSSGRPPGASSPRSRVPSTSSRRTPSWASPRTAARSSGRRSAGCS
jgi:MFS family permease